MAKKVTAAAVTEAKEVAPAAAAADTGVSPGGETEYELADPDWVREDYENYEGEAAERRARGAVVKPPEGDSTWRILPPIKGTKRLFWRPWVHSINNEVLEGITRTLAAMPDQVRGQLSSQLGVIDFGYKALGQGFKATYCSLKMKDEPCVRCKLVSALFRLADSSGALAQCKALANEIKSKEQFFCNAVRLDDKDEMERGPRILELTMGIYEKVNKIFLSEETDEKLGGDFSHPKDGFNLVITRTVDKKNTVKINGKSLPKTTYEVAPGRKRSPLAKMEWLKAMHDLTKAREWGDDNDFKALLEGDGEPVDRGTIDDPDGRAVPSSRRLAPAGEHVNADDDDGDDDDDDWIEDPDNAGEHDYRRNLRAKGRKV